MKGANAFDVTACHIRLHFCYADFRHAPSGPLLIRSGKAVPLGDRLSQMPTMVCRLTCSLMDCAAHGSEDASCGFRRSPSSASTAGAIRNAVADPVRGESGPGDGSAL